MVGYPVSGHPLDRMYDFITNKSKNISKVISWFEKLQNPDAVTEEDIPSNNATTTENISENNSEKNLENNEVDSPNGEKIKTKKIDKKEKKDEETATLIGLVAEVRHIPTKTGKNMIIAKIQSAGFDFSVIVFGRDYEVYKDKLEEDTIVIVNGKLRFDDERGEVSLSPITPFARAGEKVSSNSIKVFSITQFQSFVESSGVAIKNDSSHEKFIINIPPFWKKEDLLDLKAFLLTEEKGEIEIFISIG